MVGSAVCSFLGAKDGGETILREQVHKKDRQSLMVPWLWGGLLAGVCLFFYAAREILLPFITGAFIAYCLNPMATAFSKKGSRTGASLLSLFLFFAFFILAFLGAVPFLKTEFYELSRRLPAYIERAYHSLQPWIDVFQGEQGSEKEALLDQSVRKNFSSVFTWGLRFVAEIFSGTLAVANVVSLLVITPLVAFYFLRDWPLIITSLDQLLPRKVAPTMRDLFSKINTVLGGYARGQLMVCLVLAVYYACALKLIGLHYGLTIGIIAGFFAFIPYFGFLIGVIAAVGMGLSQFEGWLMVTLIGGIFFIGQLLESYILLPKLVGDRVGLHPVWILFALLAGGVFFGFFGLLIAMPVAAAVGVIVRFTLGVYKKSPYGSWPKQETEETPQQKRTPTEKDLPSSLLPPPSSENPHKKDD